MFWSVYIAIGAAFLQNALALPTKAARSNSVTQVRSGTYVKSGPAAMAKTYAKFGVPIPENIAHALDRQHQKRVSGSVVNTPLEFDEAYTIPISIGTPPQQMNVDLDTGSSDLWVASDISGLLAGQTPYSPEASSTSSLVLGAWIITYGDGSAAAGTIFHDVVEIGGISYPTQGVESADLESPQFLTQSNFSGLIGLAFSSLNSATPQQTTFFDNVKSTLDLPVFTADLKHGEPGTYDFGEIDTSKYTGSIAYTPVDSSEGFWSFTSSGYAVGSGSFSSTPITGIADTGTTLLYLPTDVVTAYYAQVPGAQNSQTDGGWVFPCNATIPSFTYGISGATITIPASYLNYAPNDDGTCFGGIQDDSSIGRAIFGDIALKSAFVVFDGGSTLQLGFANKTL